MKFGAHVETINFIVAPSMDRPMMLGFAWLEKWNPMVDRARKTLEFSPTHTGKKPLVEVEPCNFIPNNKGQGAGTLSCPAIEREGSLIPKKY